MKQLDFFYRELTELYKRADEVSEIRSFCDAVKQASAEFDKLESERSFCIIDEDWVAEIQRGLPYIQNAILEERQFILQNGEVVPIEKVKRVSGASFRHLASHSYMLTEEVEEGDDIVPNKLLMVENLTDYKVYENRFLYMLLCHLKEFIGFRLSNIIEIGKTYKSNLQIKKNIRHKKSSICYELGLTVEDKNDPHSEMFSKCNKLIDVIEEAHHVVCSLLLTPLMKEVAKAPMIKPPVTVTNVLRMNNNFAHALELYNFISSYTKKGYRIEVIKNSYIPLSDSIIDEFSKIIAMSSYVSYKYGNKFGDMLQERYKEYLEEQEAKNKQERKQQLLEKVASLRERLGDGEDTLIEYISALEERNQILENNEKIIDEMRAKANELRAEIDGLKSEKAEFDFQLQLKDSLIDENLKTLEEQRQIIADAEERKKEALEQKEMEFESRADDIRKEAQLAAERYKSECERLLGEEKAKVYAQADEVKRACQMDKQQAFAKADKMCDDVKRQMAEVSRKNAELKERNSLLSGEIRAVNQMRGVTTNENFDSEERFGVLEAEFDAFVNYFKKHWKLTKKQIRKDILWKIGSSSKDKKQAIEQFSASAEQNSVPLSSADAVDSNAENRGNEG